MGVVRGVDKHARGGAHALQAAGRGDGGEALPHRVHVQLPLGSGAEECLHGSQGHGGVACLVFAGERQEDVCVLASQPADGYGLPADGDLAGDHAELTAGAGDGGILRHGLFQQYSHGRRLLLGNDRHIVRRGEQIVSIPAGLDDARLLARDLLQRVAQVVRVIQPDRGDHGNVGVHHVRRVPAPAHSGLHHSHVHRRVGEGRVGHGHQHLELAHLRAALGLALRVHHFHHRLNVAPGVHVVARVQWLAVDGDAFGDDLQVRAGCPPGAAVECAHQRFDHPHHGGLAVGSRNVDHRECTLRVAEQIHQHLYALERRVDLRLRPALIQLRVDLRQRGQVFGRNGTFLY